LSVWRIVRLMTGFSTPPILARRIPFPARCREWWGCGRRTCGARRCHRRLLRLMRPTALPRHIADCVGQTHGPGGGGVSARVPGVRRRYPADRVTPKPGPVTKRLPAGAGPRRTGGSQAGEGQDGFAPRTAAPPPVSPARGPPTDWGELVQVHFRSGDFSGVTRRAARHRHPQPLMAFHATVRTAREKSGFKAGSSQREKPGLERG